MPTNKKKVPTTMGALLMTLPILTITLFISPDEGRKQKATLWQGLVVAKENRCAPYNRKDYRYSPSLKKKVLEKSHHTDKSTIDHIVALSEAHDSGLCAAGSEKKRKFASDLMNLVLLSGSENSSKGSKDAAGWIPKKNRCWFARTVVNVKKAYDLTVDYREAAALEKILGKCSPQKINFNKEK